MNAQALLRQRIQQKSASAAQNSQSAAKIGDSAQPPREGGPNLYARAKGLALAQEQKAGQGQMSPSRSALQRLRELASRLPPKQLERREVEHWREPLVPGGPRVPANYPGADAWPGDDLPPGSLHDEQAWQEARLDEMGRRCAVVEVLGQRGSFLMRLPHEQDCSTDEQRIGAFFGQAFDGCMVVLPKARPRFVGAIEPRKHHQGSQEFWVIRPRRDYLDASSSRSYLVGARWRAESRGAGPESEQEQEPCEQPR